MSYASSCLAAKKFLAQAYNAAEARHWAEAIELAWRAEANAAVFARELERARVEQDELKRR